MITDLLLLFFAIYYNNWYCTEITTDKIHNSEHNISGYFSACPQSCCFRQAICPYIRLATNKYKERDVEQTNKCFDNNFFHFL